MSECKTDDEEERVLNVDVEEKSRQSQEDVRPEMSVAESNSPQSLEQIVEQLVMQNVEIQRILQRKKRRYAKNRSTSQTETIDEGIYDSLIIPQPNLSDVDGDYVTIRVDQVQPKSACNSPKMPDSVRLNRCQMRRSLGSLHKKNDSMPEKVPEPSETRPTVGRSLSCPARQAVRITKKSEPDTVAKKIHKIINQIGSPDHWPNWIRSLSSPQQQRRNAVGKFDLKSQCDPKLGSATSPCVPSVWLRMQGEHMAEPDKKSGSLPRSFQVKFKRYQMVGFHDLNCAIFLIDKCKK